MLNIQKDQSLGIITRWALKANGVFNSMSLKSVPYISNEDINILE